MSKEDYRRIKAAFRGRTHGTPVRSPVACLTDRERLREELDSENAPWQPAIPATGYDEVVDPFEVAFVGHPDGKTYTLMRHPSEPDLMFVFTPTEWAAFEGWREGGEFDKPTD